jgi:hypothetical protein
MNHHDIAPRSGVRRLGIKAPNVSLHSLGKFFSDASELTCLHPASISVVNSSLTTPIPLMNLRHITVYDVIPGLELLLDGNMLPHLRSLWGLSVSLFAAFARRADQTKTLDTVDHLVIIDQLDNAEKSFSFKHWHIVLDALPRLKTLLVQLHNAKCPPMAMADLFIDYIRRTTGTPLTIFSCCIDDRIDADNKEHFIRYLHEKMDTVCPSIQFAYTGPTILDAWM